MAQHTEDFTINKLPGWGASITVTIACDPAAPYGIKLGLAVRVARLRGSDLSGSDLSGSDLSGEKIERLIARADRLDGYTFHAFEMQASGVKIKAGCRWFTPAEYRAHIAAEYPGTDKAKEAARILDLIEGRMADLGISAPVVKPKRVRKAARLSQEAA